MCKACRKLLSKPKMYVNQIIPSTCLNTVISSLKLVCGMNIHDALGFFGILEFD